MSFTRNAGRFAGLLYILASIPGVFALVYVPGKLIVRGNATATAHNIVVSETLFRLGIAADLICQALFIFVALALYDVLKGVNRRHALLMVTLILVSIPIALLNELNGIAALIRRSGMYGPPSQLMTNRQVTHRHELLPESRPVFTNPVHLDVKPASRIVEPR